MQNIRIIIILILLTISLNCSHLGIDMESPEIEGHYPSHNQYNVPNNSIVWVSFNEPMDRVTVEKAFSIQSDGEYSGYFQWINDQRVQYVFTQPLTTGKRYTVNITKSAQDKTGNKLIADLLYSFYINQATLTKPNISQTFPLNLSEGMAKDINISITFNKSMNYQSVQNNFSTSPSINGTFSWNANYTVMQYLPVSDLDAVTRYYVTLNKECQDTEGNQMGSDHKFNFLTGDTYTQPSVIGTYTWGNMVYWTNYQQKLNKDIEIAVQFSKTMSHPDTESAFSLNPSVNGYFTWSTIPTETLIFHPTENLQINQTYQLLVSESAKDPDNHTLASPYELHFVINGSNSQFLQITDIRDNENNSLSFINDNTVQLNQTETNTFTVYFNLTAPNQIDVPVFENSHVNISRHSGQGDDSKLGAVYSIRYNGDFTRAYIRLGDLSTNNFYLFTIDGSDSGILDKYGNYMENDVEIFFKTE